MSIPFTQYLMPNGRQVPVTIDRPAEIETKAKDLIAKGCVFEIEMLRTGQVSMTIEKTSRDDVTLAMEICNNGPEVPLAVDRMIEAALANFERRKPYERTMSARSDHEIRRTMLQNLIERMNAVPLREPDAADTCQHRYFDDRSAIVRVGRDEGGAVVRRCAICGEDV